MVAVASPAATLTTKHNLRPRPLYQSVRLPAARRQYGRWRVGPGRRRRDDAFVRYVLRPSATHQMQQYVQTTRDVIGIIWHFVGCLLRNFKREVGVGTRNECDRLRHRRQRNRHWWRHWYFFVGGFLFPIAALATYTVQSENYPLNIEINRFCYL